MRIALVIFVPALCAGLASSAWADKDKDKDKGHGRGHGPPGQTVVVPQPLRVVVPDRDRTTVYTYYRTEFRGRPLSARLGPKGQWLPASGPGQKALGRGSAAAAGGCLLPRAARPHAATRAGAAGLRYVRVDNDVLLMDMVNRMVADVIDDLNEPD